MKKAFRTAAVVMLGLLLASGAVAEKAAIVTPGGKLKMRREPSEKAKIQTYVPNGAEVELQEQNEEWCRITYKGDIGYVLTEFVRFAQQLAGKTVYSNGETVLLYSQPRQDAEVAGVIAPNQAVEVRLVENGWLKVTVQEWEGWTQADGFSVQHEAPQKMPSWMPEPAQSVTAQPMFIAASETSAVLKELAPGEHITVYSFTDGWCLAETDGMFGYLPMARVRLSGLADQPMMSLDVKVNQDKARSNAAAALKKAYAGYSKVKTTADGRLMDSYGTFEQPVYRFAFCDENGCCLFAALIDAENGKTLMTTDYRAFSSDEVEKPKLPQGTLNAVLNADTLKIGEALQITVTEAWNTSALRYGISLNGETLVVSQPGEHMEAWYRPLREGEYTVTITAVDEENFAATTHLTFTVSGQAEVLEEEIYSQKDGWWADKAYRNSNLEQSGCAVFTLSHALRLMGKSSSKTTPEALASTYALCLTSTGTNNERLTRQAAADFGFKTQGTLIESKSKIVDLMKNGAMFTFSVARGHIALICELAENEKMVRIIDSAPSATFERISGAALYYRNQSGSFVAARSLDDLPGARWYPENDSYGGMTYWLELSYVANRGVRLIQPNP